MKNSIISESKLIFLLLLIVPVQQMAIDIYLPSMPSMVNYFSSTDSLIKLTLSFYVLTLGFSQLIYGQLSEVLGRKKPLLIGLSIFIIGSILASTATSIYGFLFARFIEGLGIGCGFVCITSILSDSFSGNRLARVTSYTSMVYSLAPLLAPVLGSYIHHYSHWKVNFVFLSIYSVILFILLFFLLPETAKYKNKHAFKIKPVLKIYQNILSNSVFWGFVLCQLFAFAIMIVFNIIGPFILQNILHVHIVLYGKLLFIIGAAYLLGATCNQYLVKLIAVEKLILIGIILMAISSLMLLILSEINIFNLYTVVSMTFLCIFGTGFVFPNSYARAIEVFPDKVGPASALMGAIGLVGNAILSMVIAMFKFNSAIGLSTLYLLITVACYMSYLLAKKRKHLIISD